MDDGVARITGAEWQLDDLVHVLRYHGSRGGTVGVTLSAGVALEAAAAIERGVAAAAQETGDAGPVPSPSTDLIRWSAEVEAVRAARLRAAGWLLVAAALAATALIILQIG